MIKKDDFDEAYQHVSEKISIASSDSRIIAAALLVAGSQISESLNNLAEANRQVAVSIARKVQ